MFRSFVTGGLVVVLVQLVSWTTFAQPPQFPLHRQAEQALDPEFAELFQRAGEDVRGRDRWWYIQRAYPSRSFPENAHRRALRQARAMPGLRGPAARKKPRFAPPVPGVCNWVEIGPRNINGRIRSLALDPTNANTVFAGAASGGLWKSTDAGQSWYPLMQYEDSIAVGSIAIDPSNPNVIYVGTGEPTWWPGYEGVGVLKSVDGGVTWSATGTMANGHIARVIIDPNATNILYCAGFSGGLYKSVDSAVTWTLIQAGDVTDVVINPADSAVLYSGIRNDGVYKSVDAGATWTKLAGGLPATASNRVMLSLCAAATDTVYAKLDQTIYKTTDAGATWSNQGNHGSTTYGYWCTYVAVDPTNPDIVFAAGTTLERSIDGGATWTLVAGGSDPERDRLHADQHAMVFDPANPQTIYAGNDGGVYLSNDGANTWTKVSDGLIITQFYDVGVSPATPTLIGGGTQDQGTNATVGGLTWEYLFNADGGFMVFHPTDPYTMYGETQYSNIRKSTDGGNSWSLATSGLTGSGPWIGAITIDHPSPNILFTGRQNVFRTTNGATTWTSSSPTVGGSVLAVAIAPSDSMIVYAGTSTGEIWRSSDGGATLANWNDVTAAPLPNRFCTDIVVDRTDPDIVYVSYSGFDATTPTTPGHVFRSDDGGATWNNISGTSGAVNALPDTPANAIEIDALNPNTLYVGTDTGMFITTNLGATWLVYEPNFPEVAVTDLELDESRNILTAATHGRGMWQIDVSAPASCADVDIYVRDHFLDTGQQIPSTSNVIDPFSVIRGGSIGGKVYRWQSPDVKIDALPLYTPDALFDGVEFDRDLFHDNPVRTETNTTYVQIHNRGPLDASNVTVKVLWADATAGLPPLPSDFWSQYPNDSTDTSVWHPIGLFQTIPVLNPNRPQVLSWSWTPPASAANHSCILLVIDSVDDPIPSGNKSTNVNWLIGNEKHVALKNLHVIDAAPGPGGILQPTVIKFHNDVDNWQAFDIVVDRKSFPVDGELSLTFDRLQTRRDLQKSVHGANVARDQRKGRTIFTSAAEATIKGAMIAPKGYMQARIEVALPPRLKPGSRYRFTIMQRRGKEIVGGSTYEIRVAEPERDNRDQLDQKQNK